MELPLVKFNRWEAESSGKFTFLGFDFFWGKSRHNPKYWRVRRVTNAKKFRNGLKALKSCVLRLQVLRLKPPTTKTAKPTNRSPSSCGFTSSKIKNPISSINNHPSASLAHRPHPITTKIARQSRNVFRRTAHSQPPPQKHFRPQESPKILNSSTLKFPFIPPDISAGLRWTPGPRQRGRYPHPARKNIDHQRFPSNASRVEKSAISLADPLRIQLFATIMNTSHAKWALIATTALLGVPCNAMAADGDSRTSSIQLTHEIAKEAVSYGDLNAMAAAIGIDYPVLLERAVSKKPAAVFLLLWMAGNAPLDGAGAEGYTYTMVRAAKAIGDDILSVATQKLDASAQQAVIEAFLFEYGGTDEPEQAASEVSKAFPKLWAAIRKRQGEQAGTGQPATRPESKSEGNVKPQPEAEGRSR